MRGLRCDNEAVSSTAKPQRNRKGPVLILLGGVLVGIMALSVGFKRRPAGLDKKGKFETLSAPSGAFEIRMPAFLVHYGAAKVLGAPQVIGARVGDPERGNFVVMAISKADAPPFEGEGFEGWLAESYLDCLATGDSGTGRNWWAVQESIELQSQPYKIKYAVSKNTIPLVSRLCLAATNTLADVNVRFYGAFTGVNYDNFAADLRAMVESLSVDETRVKQRLDIRQAPAQE
jgi:hypothetical protein